MIYLNLGCGNRKNKYCINIDCCKKYKPDFICDVEKLPYKFNSIDGIYALDVLEHISMNNIFKTLELWYKILKPNGFLVLRLPNLRIIVKKYINKEISNNRFAQLMFGKQEQNDFVNFHKSGFDKESLINLLIGIGFKETKNDTNIKCNSNNMLLKFRK